MQFTKHLCLLGAIALLGMTACQQENIQQQDDPTAKEEVNTQFVFSLDLGSGQATKQTAADTQADLTQDFRGLSSAYLAAYKLTADGKKVTDPDLAAEKWYPLGELVSAGSLDPDAISGSIPQSRRVINLSLPTGTNAMVFYGQAKKDKTDAQQGKVSIIGGNNLTATTIKMQPRLPDSTSDEYKYFSQSYDLMSWVLNMIINIGINGTDDLASESMTISYPGDPAFSAQLHWKDYARTDGKSPVAEILGMTSTPSATALENILGNAYTQLTTLREVTVGGVTTQEIRAGSGPAIARTVGDLFLVIDKVASNTAYSIQDQVAITIAGKITARIHEFFNGSGSTCKWLNITSILSGVDQYYSNVTYGGDATKARFADLRTAIGDVADLNKFPGNFNIPDGAAVLLFNAAPSVQYANFYYNFGTIDVSGMGMSGGTVGVDHYLYPAELCYFGNSALRVSKTEFLPGQYPDGAATWETEGSWGSAWSVGHVESSTNSVAIKDNINYGTALLQTTVAYDAATLKDNNSGIHPGETDTSIDVTTAGAFELTGIIIGGQTNTLGWDFLPLASSTFNYLIYDGIVSNSAIPAYTASKPESAPLYTMVMDNYDRTKAIDAQAPVYVGLEFKNTTGTDFWGMHNLVRNGGTFYIIGKLDPTASGAITLPSDYDLPPYTSTTDATSVKAKRVFIQSFKTEAHFYLTANSLKSAYVTVPDLRSTELSLGMSVDVSWHSGINFSRIELGAF